MDILWDRVSRDEWCAAARAFADLSLYQHWDYGAVHSRGIGRRVVRIAVRDRGRTKAMAQCRIKALPFTGQGVAEIDWGPLWLYEGEAQAGALQALLQALRTDLVERLGLTLRVTPRGGPDCDVARLEDLLLQEGLVHNGSVRAYQTFYLDLHKNLEGLRKGLKQKWRYNLNRAQHQNLSVVVAQNGQAFHGFEQIYWPMWKRKRFPTGVRIAAIRELQGLLPAEDRLTIVIANVDGVPVGAHVAVVLGNTCQYLLGATSDAGLSRNAGYLLHWTALQEAKRHGLRWYDLGGFDTTLVPGVARFKAGMSGVAYAFPGQYDLRPSKSRSKVYVLAERGFRGLRSRLRREHTADQDARNR